MKITGKIESQHILESKTSETDLAVWKYQHYRTDFQFFIGTKISPVISITGGYQYRLEISSINSHRPIQQIAFEHKNTRFKIAHRIRSDQTFAHDIYPEFRLRYRISFRIPLQGKSLDPKEFYLNLSDEIIYGFQGGENKIENRLVGMVGYYINKKQKIEFGIDYRTDKFFDPELRHRTWLKIGWYVSIPYVGKDL